MLIRGTISWRRARHTLIAPSTMAMEFVARYAVSNQGIWVRNFITRLRILDELKYHFSYFVTINQQRCIQTIVGVPQSKFIDIKCLIVKEIV